jgi:FkbM family methyltransferase
MNRPLVSYAQNREDLILEGYFPEVTDGFYVDVGANHPLKHSVTKLFYQKGWHGINLEPNGSLWDMLQFDRTRDSNLNLGVSDKSGTLSFTEYANHGLSTFSDEMREAFAHESSVFTDTYRQYDVPVRTLAQIFADQKVTHIHFMKVDVEGYEYEVLKGNDWTKYRPEMICIESNHIVHDWRPLLDNNGYAKVFNDGLNDYYLAAEAMDRAQYFSYAKKLLESGEVMTIPVYEQLGNLQNELRVARLRLQEATTQKIRAEFQANWYEQAPLKWMLKKTVRAFDRAVTNRVHRRPVMQAAFNPTATVRVAERLTGKELHKLTHSYAHSAWSATPPLSSATVYMVRPVGKAYMLLRRIAAKAVRSMGRT